MVPLDQLCHLRRGYLRGGHCLGNLPPTELPPTPASSIGPRPGSSYDHASASGSHRTSSICSETLKRSPIPKIFKDCPDLEFSKQGEESKIYLSCTYHLHLYPFHLINIVCAPSTLASIL